MLVSSLNNVNTQGLLNIADIYNLKQLITEPTRVTPVSSTLIDVIFTSHPDNIFGINDNLLLGEKTFFASVDTNSLSLRMLRLC